MANSNKFEELYQSYEILSESIEKVIKSPLDTLNYKHHSVLSSFKKEDFPIWK